MFLNLTSCPSVLSTQPGRRISPRSALFPQLRLKMRPQLDQRLVVHGAHRLRIDADDLRRLARRHVTLVQQLPHQGLARRQQALGNLRSEEHTSELQPLMRISYAVFGLKKKK